MIARTLLLTLLWLAIGGSRPDAWLVGVPTILLALALSYRLSPAGLRLPRWGALAAFSGFMLREMIIGALVTVRWTLLPRARLHPGVVRVESELRHPVARALLVNAVNLIPGTVSISLRGRIMELHLLDVDTPAQEECRRLEEKIAALFDKEGG